MQTGRFTRLAAMGIIIATLTLPGLSAAADATVTTGVIIPAGTQSCQSPVISGITPYVYDNQLNSFDLTVSDASYVAVVGSVGQTGIPLRQMLRSINPDGSLKIHVDINSTAIPGSLPISLTLLSSKPGAPTCLTAISFPVEGRQGYPVTPSQTTYPTATHTTQPSTHPSTSTSGTSSPGTAATSAPPVVGGGLQSALSRVCNAAGAYQLWFILLALFMVGIGLVAFAEPPLTRKSTELPAALIIVPLVLLLLFWYAVPACRVAVWIPIVLLIAAALALLAAYREKTPGGGMTPARQLPSPKPEAPKTGSSAAIPMPAGKSTVPMKTIQTTTVITPHKAEQTKTTVTPTKVEQTKTVVTPASQPKK
jgi:hypothetical protein